MSIQSFLTACRVTGIDPQSNGEVLATCPHCDKRRHFSFNKAKQTYQCFKCGETGNAFTLAKKQSPSLSNREVFELMEEHDLKTNGKAEQKPKAKPTPSPTKHTGEAKEKALDLMCRKWRVSRQTLDDLRYGFGVNDKGQPAYVFPMFDGDKVTGEQTWVPGRKRYIRKYARQGLFRPATIRDGLLIVAEGCSDTAAAHDAGLNVAGTPGAGQAAGTLARVVKDRNVVILADYDTAGVNGANKLATKIHATAAGVKIWKPSEKGHDFRDWRDAGGTREKLLAEVEALPEFEPAAKPARNQPDDDDAISNCELVEIENTNGDSDKPKFKLEPLPIEEIKTAIRERTDNWPRRVGQALFVDDSDHGIAWLQNAEALFGWLGSKTGIVKWHSKVTGAVTRGELTADLRRTADAYQAVESLPHEPPMASHYYACGTPEPGDGSTLAELIDQFKPSGMIDRDLILSAFATPLWGGDGGTRPAFVVTSDHGQGSGKTELAGQIAYVFGGAIELSPNEEISVVKQRLLSDDALTRRIALIDNVKALKFSWADLESLITTPVISGKKMYVGEATRPNSLTWFVTLNGVSLGSDLAQRAVIIKLDRPTYSATFREDSRRFIDTNRDRLIADLIGFLREEPRPLRRFSRWASWERDVLARLPEPTEAQGVILERQGDADADADEAGTVEDYFAGQLSSLNFNPDRDRVHIPVAVAARWYNWALNERATVTSVTQQINSWSNRGDVKHLAKNPTRTYGRGFLWIGDDAEPMEYVAYDLQSRITERQERRRE